MTFYALARWVLNVLFRSIWRMRVNGTANVPMSGPLIVACNHVSYFDPPALGAALPRPVSYMAKQELFAVPILGSTITALNAFPVDRSRGDVAAIKRSVATLKEGRAVGIFPEGGRNRDGTKMPQSGVALLASLSGAPVLPARIEGTRHANRLAQIRVSFGEPIDFRSRGKATREDLAKWTEEIMSRIDALRENQVDH